MDKAQEKIKEYLDGARKCGTYAEPFDLDVAAQNVLKSLEELGYRKIEGKPPLLTKEEAEKGLPITAGRKSVPFYMKAQRDSDIKWMRGE